MASSFLSTSAKPSSVEMPQKKMHYVHHVHQMFGAPMRDLLRYLEWRIRYEKQQHKVQNEKQTRKHFEEYRLYLLVFAV